MAYDIPVCGGPSLWLRNRIDDESDVALEDNGLIQYYQAFSYATQRLGARPRCAIILFFYSKSCHQIILLPTV